MNILQEITCSKFAFANNEMRSISFPYSLKTIGEESFYENRQLKSLFIPESVVLIETLAFAFCENLERVVIVAKNITIEDEGVLWMWDIEYSYLCWRDN